MLYLKVFLELIFFKLLINFLSFESLKKAIAFFILKSKKKEQLTQAEISEIAFIINRVSTLKPSIFNCLPKAITMMYNCRSNKEVKLMIGVRLNEHKEFEFHAWVVSNNKIVIGEIDKVNFEPLWTWN